MPCQVDDAGDDWFGASHTRLRGRHVSELLGPALYPGIPGIPGIFPTSRPVLAGEPRHFVREFPEIDGHVRALRLTYEPNIVNDRVDGFFILGIDISEQV